MGFAARRTMSAQTTWISGTGYDVEGHVLKSKIPPLVIPLLSAAVTSSLSLVERVCNELILLLCEGKKTPIPGYTRNTTILRNVNTGEM